MKQKIFAFDKKEVICLKFKMLIDSKGIKVADIETALGLKRTAVQKWIAGKSKPKIRYLPILAQILNVSTEEILRCFE